MTAPHEAPAGVDPAERIAAERMQHAADALHKVTIDILYLPAAVRDKALVAHEAALAAYLRALDQWTAFFPPDRATPRGD